MAQQSADSPAMDLAPGHEEKQDGSIAQKAKSAPPTSKVIDEKCVYCQQVCGVRIYEDGHK